VGGDCFTLAFIRMAGEGNGSHLARRGGRAEGAVVLGGDRVGRRRGPYIVEGELNCAVDRRSKVSSPPSSKSQDL
jgi:hypothetical protein